MFLQRTVVQFLKQTWFLIISYNSIPMVSDAPLWLWGYQHACSKHTVLVTVLLLWRDTMSMESLIKENISLLFACSFRCLVYYYGGKHGSKQQTRYCRSSWELCMRIHRQQERDSGLGMSLLPVTHFFQQTQTSYSFQVVPLLDDQVFKSMSLFKLPQLHICRHL